MKPIRVVVLATGDEGTWIDSVAGPTEVYAVIVLDNGEVFALFLSSFKVKSPNEVKLRAMQ